MIPQTIIKESNFEKARKLIKANSGKICINSSSGKSQIREAHDKEIIFSSDNDELNRKILEKEKINILLINLAGRKDFQKQRNSGFNQVLAKIAQKNNITIGINFDEIIESSQFEKEKIFARIKQNIKLCNKNKLKMKFIIQNSKNQRNIYDLKSLGSVLGMGTWMTWNL